jgi:hypothetical protein
MADRLIGPAGSAPLTRRDGTVIDVDVARPWHDPDIVQRALLALYGEPDLISWEHQLQHRLHAHAAAPPAAAAPLRVRDAPTRPRPLLPVDRRSIPPELAHVGIAAVQTAPCEYEVRLQEGADVAGRCWARAFDSDGTLVALAPFREDRRYGRALLLVPPPRGHPDIDVTAEPAMARPSSAFEAVERAITVGRRAARCDRTGDRVGSSREWSTCAEEWEHAGDEIRARLAVRYSRGEDAEHIPAPLSDPVV